MPIVHGHASNVHAEDGEVHVDGPNGIAYSMTPDAARETGDRLSKGAAQAQGQRDDKKRLDDERAAGE